MPSQFSETIRVKEIEISMSGNLIRIKYDCGSKKLSLEDRELARPELNEVLRKLDATAYRILGYESIIDEEAIHRKIRQHFMCTGAKFKYSVGTPTRAMLLGVYILPNKKLLRQNYPYLKYGKIDDDINSCYTNDECILLNKLLAEAQAYIRGERAQKYLDL